MRDEEILVRQIMENKGQREKEDRLQGGQVSK